MALRRIAFATVGRRLFTTTTFRCNKQKAFDFPTERAPEDEFSQQSMIKNFKNMFDRGPNVGVEVITKDGFVLSNNVQIKEPLVLLNGSAFLWRVPQDAFAHDRKEPLDLDAFKIFEVAAPKPGKILQVLSQRQFGSADI